MKQAFVNCVCEKSEIMYLDIESQVLLQSKQSEENTKHLRDIYLFCNNGHLITQERKKDTKKTIKNSKQDSYNSPAN